MIFIDADYYIGLYYKDDAHHDHCLDLAKKIKINVITSWDVIDEVTTKLLYRVNKTTASYFLADIRSGVIKFVFPDYELFLKAIEISEKQSSKNVSMTDCMNMAIARSIGITTFLSFDQIYEKNGFTLFR